MPEEVEGVEQPAQDGTHDEVGVPGAEPTEPVEEGEYIPPPPPAPEPTVPPEPEVPVDLPG